MDVEKITKCEEGLESVLESLEKILKDIPENKVNADEIKNVKNRLKFIINTVNNCLQEDEVSSDSVFDNDTL